MISFSEIETTVKRATRSVGFSWGISEEVGKNIRLLEMFGLPGVKNINQYFKIYNLEKFENIYGLKNDNYSSTRIYAFLAERFLPYWFNKYTKCLEWPIAFYDTIEKR